jgi:uncharacterized OsmC-like protein
MGDLNFSITAISENPTKTIVEARNFKMIVDEPSSLGGTDQGANPVEYLLAALAGCLNVVGHVVAKEMGFELRGVKIEIAGDLNPAKFLGQSDEERAGYKSLKISITPDTEADLEILGKWLALVKERCPVSDSISNLTPVSIALK